MTWSSSVSSQLRLLIKIIGSPGVVPRMRHNVFSYLSTEAKYLGMADTVCKNFFIRSLVMELCLQEPTQIFYYDNKASIFNTTNLMFHTEVDTNHIHEKVLKELTTIPNVTPIRQLSDIFTKSINRTSYDTLCTKLSLSDIFILA